MKLLFKELYLFSTIEKTAKKIIFSEGAKEQEKIHQVKSPVSLILGYKSLENIKGKYYGGKNYTA